MTWWIASLVSNVAIIATEYLNRHATGGWLSVLPQTFPLIVVAQFCLFLAFNGAPHWFTAWAFFTIGNSVMRVGAVAVQSDHGVGNWWLVSAGVFVMVGGSGLLKTGLR